MLYLVTISNGSGLDSHVIYEDEVEAPSRADAERQALDLVTGSLDVEVCGPLENITFEEATHGD